MKLPIRLALCIVALFPPLAALADGDNGIKVDIVVDMTDAGKQITRPDPQHPAYYYAIVKGYTEGGAKIGDQGPPPPTNEVLHEVAKALYDQGYRFYNKAHQPSLLLMFWWGYKAPITASNGGYVAKGGGIGGQSGGGAAGITSFLNSNPDASNALLNGDEMKELVLGSDYQSGFGDTEKNLPGVRMARLKDAWLVPRYYLMVSALDFKAAMTKDDHGRPNMVVYWTARISTDLVGHSLAEVLPTLIKDAAPAFGRKTSGPQWTETPLVPIGQVIVGTPTLKQSTPASAAPQNAAP